MVSVENVVFPADAGQIDITRPPFNAVGDGRHDDTAAIQSALDAYAGSRHALYLPNGTYLVSRTLRVPLKNPQGNFLYGNTLIQGQSRSKTVLRLKDATFTEPGHPAALLDFGPHGSADWFACFVRNLTFDIGKSNPGATGLRFFSNNTGSVREVTIRSGDGQGVVGLDLAYNDMNGPLLVKQVAVSGFRTGVLTGNSVNSQAFWHLVLEGQTECGLLNAGQCVSIEGLTSRNRVPAIRNTNSLMTLIRANLSVPSTVAMADAVAAIENGADLFAREIAVQGYREAIRETNPNKKPGSAVSTGLMISDYGPKLRQAGIAGLTLREYASDAPITLFPSNPHSLNLPAEEAPDIPWEDPKTWRSPFDFGAERQEGSDISEGLQKAIDSGATTVYIPTGAWRISHTIYLRKNLRRLNGMASYLIPEEPVNSQDAPFFQLDGGTAPVILLENLSCGFGSKKVYGIQHNSRQTLILRDLELYAYRNRPSVNTKEQSAGKLFIEDVVGGLFYFDHQRVYAWQLNQESEGTHIQNRGGKLRILGLKTERGGTLIETKEGGATEVLGGLCYTTTAGKLAPMFTTTDSQISVTLGERCFSGDPYTVILRETQKETVREIPNSDTRYKGRLVLYTNKRPK